MTFKTPFSQLEDAMHEYLGFCTDCGAEHGECEPDARQRRCDECGARAVYGAEELMMMGLVDEDA